MNTVYIPEKVIPGHSIDSCLDCPHYNTIRGNLGECHFKSPPAILINTNIPNWCPLLAGNPL
jgi:hypothetical protein